MSQPSGPSGPYPYEPEYPQQGSPAQYPQGQYGPGQYAPFTPPTPAASASRPSRRPLWLAALGGFVLAGVIAVVLALTGVLPGGDAADDVSSDSVSLPSKVASYQTIDQASANRSARGRKNAAQFKADNGKTADALSTAHNGAGAAVQTYADDKLETIFQVWAVRGYTPPPVVAHQDADYLGLAQPQQVVRRYGDTYCSLSGTRAYAKGQKPPKNSYYTLFCQRSHGQLTVILTGAGGSDFSQDPAGVAGAVDDVWGALT